MEFFASFMYKIKNITTRIKINFRLKLFGGTDKRVYHTLIWVDSLNTGSLLNIGNGPQSGPSVYNGAKGRKAHHSVEKPISGI